MLVITIGFDTDKMPKPTPREYLQGLHSSRKRLKKYINDMLEYGISYRDIPRGIDDCFKYRNHIYGNLTVSIKEDPKRGPEGSIAIEDA